MKGVFLRYIVLFMGLFVYVVQAQAQVSCEEGKYALRALQTFHYAPKELNRSTAESFYLSFLKDLDEHKLYLTQENLDRMQSQSGGLTDTLGGGICQFSNTAWKEWHLQLEKCENNLNDILDQPLDFSVEESVFNGKQEEVFEGWSQNDEELKQRWRQWSKFMIAGYYAMRYLDQEDGRTDFIAALQGDQKEGRDKLRENYHCFFEAMDQYGEAYLNTSLFNGMARSYDPHSNFFSQKRMESFSQGLSAEAYTFGIEWDQTDLGETQISYLTPGGPAWKSNRLHVGDVLLAIHWKDSVQRDLSCWSPQDIQTLFQLSEETSIQLEVRKKDGSEQLVTVVSEVMKVDENVMDGFVLNGSKKVGYINLPGFYTHWQGETTANLGCSNDLAKELILLKRESIEGLIIDLRYNGGGSVQEALALAGIFIDVGNFGAVHYPGEKRAVLKDPNRGMVFRGPLVFLINTYSASASEMVCGIMQEHNRAVILGTPSYGKGSGQSVIGLEDYVSLTHSRSDQELTGNVKVTRLLLYRNDGSSHQLTGIQPDLLMPNPFHASSEREKDEEGALQPRNDIEPVYHRPSPELPLEELRKKHQARLAADTLIQRWADAELKSSKDTLSGPCVLRPDEFADYYLSDDLELSSDDLERISTLYKVENHRMNDHTLQYSTELKNENDQILDNISTDITIEQAYQVILDWIELNP